MSHENYESRHKSHKSHEPYFPISIGFEIETNNMCLVHQYSKNHVRLPKYQFKQKLISKSPRQQDYELYCYNDKLQATTMKMKSFVEKMHQEKQKCKTYLIPSSSISIDNIDCPLNNAEFVMTFFRIQEIIQPGKEKEFISKYLLKSCQNIEFFFDRQEFSISSFEENKEFPYSYYLSKVGEKYGFFSYQKKIQDIRFMCQCTVGLPLHRVVDFLSSLQPHLLAVSGAIQIIDYIHREWILDSRFKIRDSSEHKSFIFLFIMNTIFNNTLRKKNMILVRASFFEIFSLITDPIEKEIIIHFFETAQKKQTTLPPIDEKSDKNSIFYKIHHFVNWKFFQEIKNSSEKQTQKQQKQMRMVTRIFPKRNPLKIIYIEIRNLQDYLFQEKAIPLSSIINRLSDILPSKSTIKREITSITKKKLQEQEVNQKQKEKSQQTQKSPALKKLRL